MAGEVLVGTTLETEVPLSPLASGSEPVLLAPILPEADVCADRTTPLELAGEVWGWAPELCSVLGIAESITDDPCEPDDGEFGPACSEDVAGIGRLDATTPKVSETGCGDFDSPDCDGTPEDRIVAVGFWMTLPLDGVPEAELIGGSVVSETVAAARCRLLSVPDATDATSDTLPCVAAVSDTNELNTTVPPGGVTAATGTTPDAEVIGATLPPGEVVGPPETTVDAKGLIATPSTGKIREAAGTSADVDGCSTALPPGGVFKSGGVAADGEGLGTTIPPGRVIEAAELTADADGLGTTIPPGTVVEGTGTIGTAPDDCAWVPVCSDTPVCFPVATLCWAACDTAPVTDEAIGTTIPFGSIDEPGPTVF